MLLEILVKNLRVLPVDTNDGVTPVLKAGFLAELANLGYRVKNPEVYTNSILTNFDKIMRHLKKMKGGKVKYVPLFQGFPENCPEKDEFLMKRVFGFFGNLTGYIDKESGKTLDNGIVVPEWLFDLDDFGADPIMGRQDEELFNKGIANQKKRKKDTHTVWTDLEFIDASSVEEKTNKFLRNNLYAKSSLKEDLKPTIEYLLRRADLLSLDFGKIVFKETKAYLMGYLWGKKDLHSLTELINTPTDILRMFAAVTETDISLTAPIKFPKLTRLQRRFLLGTLNQFGNLAEDMYVYKGLWLKIGKGLHPGELTHKKMYPKAFAAFDLIRNGKIVTYNSRIEQSLINKEITPTLLSLLSERPGAFARRIHHILELSTQPEETLAAFKSVAEKVTLKNLLVLNSYFETIDNSKYRAIINKKGSVRVIDNKQNRIKKKVTAQVICIIQEAILSKIGTGKDSWEDKSVWIDPSLRGYTLPLQQRKASDGLLTLGRGSRIPLDIDKVLRLFVYWKQTEQMTDLDLSLITYDKDMNLIGQVSYTNLSEGKIAHSGDITSSSQGAAEFIDIPISKLKDKKIRYVASQIYRYSGERFSDMVCHAGWMVRDKVDSNYSSFDIKTVQNKFDLKGKGAYSIPVLVDILKKEIVFVDIYVNGIESYNRVEGAYTDISVISQEMARMIDTKPNMSDLATFHAKGRKAAVVSDKEDADITFGIQDCDYNVGDTALVLDELL